MLPDLLRRVFPGEGQVATRLRAIDWSTHELGSPDTWPRQLQAAVGVCLASRLPMQVWWGPNLILLYNDASIRFLDGKHPSVLARSGRAWLEIANQLDGVLARQTTWCKDVRLTLGPTEAFVTFLFTPIVDTDGDTLGMFCTLVDSTAGVVAKRRIDTLDAVGIATSSAPSVADACTAIVSVLADSDDIAFAVLQLADGSRFTTGIDLVPEEVGEVAATVFENDVIANVKIDKPAIALPVQTGDGVGAVLVCGLVRARPLDASYRRFLELVAAQIGAALAEANIPGSGEDLRRNAHTAGRPNDAFLAVLGHELRNPLSALMTTLQALMLRGPSPEIELMERSVRHLSRVVDNLLDVSRLARGKLELQAKRTELAQIVDRAMEHVHALFTERKTQVFVRVPRVGLRLEVDHERVAQAIANLLANAAKYSEPGSRVWIESQRIDDSVHITVRDDGSGIEPDRLASVFEAFQQPPETRPRSSGIGLGLAIARSLVELHGGELTIRSEGAGRGTECVIELPCNAAVAAPPGPRKRLLLVEDNDDTARALKNGLEQLGYVVAVAHNAPIALNLARTFEPDVALLDIGLPVMDGWELARRLREQRRGDLHIVAVTAYDQDADKRRSQEAGFAEHLVKPIDLAKLEEIVESLPTRT